MYFAVAIYIHGLKEVLDLPFIREVAPEKLSNVIERDVSIEVLIDLVEELAELDDVLWANLTPVGNDVVNGLPQSICFAESLESLKSLGGESAV
jgi:hypothetical protein